MTADDAHKEGRMFLVRADNNVASYLEVSDSEDLTPYAYNVLALPP